MSDHCPQDGGFIGKCGCTHPNHQHSKLVDGLLKEKSPRAVSKGECDAALDEGFYVDSGSGRRVGFGKNLKDHLTGKNDEDERKSRLLYAVDAVRSPDDEKVCTVRDEKRRAYGKRHGDKYIEAVSAPESDEIEYVFTIIPKDGRK